MRVGAVGRGLTLGCAQLGRNTMKNLWRILLILVALLVVTRIGWVSEIHAQTRPEGLQAAPGAGRTMQVEGKIKSMNPSGRMVTLEDGIQLTIPPNASVPPGVLKEGAIVKATFEEQGRQKIVISLEVRAQ